MGVQSTRYITREAAITRINKVSFLVALRDYEALENTTSEPDLFVEDFINTPIETQGYNKWTNTMLADKMDEPFYRYSMFDNYLISEDI